MQIQKRKYEAGIAKSKLSAKILNNFNKYQYIILSKYSNNSYKIDDYKRQIVLEAYLKKREVYMKNIKTYFKAVFHI